MTRINMADDSHVPSPPEMSALLADLSRDASADYYGQGGAVEAFEKQVAAFLGKEQAVMFPTGILGNMMALQRLSGGAPSRVVVHRHSHLFNDSGDNLSQLAGLTMVPLEGEGAGFSAQQLGAEIARTASARVGSRIGAVVVESPSRRLDGRRFGSELQGVIDTARGAGLPLYLDGARVLIECAWTGQSPAAMAAPFDMVYLSLYKYLKAPFGCIVAGPSAMFKDMNHDRRRFGGSLYQMWPAAVLAADALPRQEKLWSQARKVGEACIDLLTAQGHHLTLHPDGTNVFLCPCNVAPDVVKAAGAAESVSLLPPAAGKLAIKINETWIGQDPASLAERLTRVFRKIA